MAEGYRALVGASGFHPRRGLVDEADWDTLMNAALIHADIWGSGNFASVPILNKLLQDYGITPAARSQIMPAEVQKQERHTPLDEIAERRKLRVIQGGKAKRRTGT